MHETSCKSSIKLVSFISFLCLLPTINANANPANETIIGPQQSYLTNWLAHKAAKAAIKQCRENGHRVSVSVVDNAGLLKILIRDDGAGPHTIDSSRKKAYTAASLRASTLDLSERIANNSSLQGLHNLNDEVLMLGGGLPLMVGDQVIGGIGVAGAPGANLDDDCARIGLKEIGMS